MRLPFTLRAAFSIAILVVLGVAALSFRNSRTLLDESDWVIHAHEVRRTLSQLLSNVEAAATAERGFVLTGDETYLGPYNTAEREIPDHLRQLRALVSDNAEQQWRLNGLGPRVETLLAAMRETIDARRRDEAVARGRIDEATRKNEVDAVRDGVRDMEAAESRMLRQRADAVAAAARLTTSTFAFAAVLVFVLIGLLYVAVRHHLRLRNDAEKAREELLSREQAARVAAEVATRKLAEADQAKDAFLAMVSHELRTPLSSTMTWAEVLKRGPVEAEQVRLAVEAIQRATKQQVQLIEDLLDISRIVAGRMRLEVGPVDLAEIVRSAVEEAQPMADAKRVGLRTALHADGLPMSGDGDRLLQVVGNLLSNAVKFTPEGGSVTVALGRSNAHAEIAVRDTGRGIPAEFLPHLFEQFRQAEAGGTRRAGGLGLGLAIVQHIVEAHGGSVHAESAGPGKGAVFTVKLPLISADRPPDRS